MRVLVVEDGKSHCGTVYVTVRCSRVTAIDHTANGVDGLLLNWQPKKSNTDVPDCARIVMLPGLDGPSPGARHYAQLVRLTRLYHFSAPSAGWNERITQPACRW